MNVLLWTHQHDGTTRRHRMVTASEEFFASWWTTSKPDAWQTLRCKQGLPEGARLVGLAHDPERNEVRFIFEHESFQEIPNGNDLPTMSISFESRT